MVNVNAVNSIQPRPDEEMVGVVMRLKHNDDFKKFMEVFMRGRVGVLAYLACAPAFTERQVQYIHGRVHELADLVKMIDDIEKTRATFDETKRAEGA